MKKTKMLSVESHFHHVVPFHHNTWHWPVDIQRNGLHCLDRWGNKYSSQLDTFCEEQWYEDKDTLNSVVPSLNIVAQWTDPQQTTYPNTPLIDETIHSGFITEAKTRRVARKCRHRRQIDSSESLCEEDDPSNVFTFLDHEKNICSQTSQTQAIPPANNKPEMYNEMTECSQTSEERPLLCQGEIIPPANIEPTCTELAQTIPPANIQPTSTELTHSPVEVHIPPADNHPSTSTGITHAPVSEETNDTPDVWKLNDKVYMRRVADLITFNFYKDLQRGHVHTFTECVHRPKWREMSRNNIFGWKRIRRLMRRWWWLTGSETCLISTHLWNTNQISFHICNDYAKHWTCWCWLVAASLPTPWRRKWIWCRPRNKRRSTAIFPIVLDYF